MFPRRVVLELVLLLRTLCAGLAPRTIGTERGSRTVPRGNAGGAPGARHRRHIETERPLNTWAGNPRILAGPNNGKSRGGERGVLQASAGGGSPAAKPPVESAHLKLFERHRERARREGGEDQGVEEGLEDETEAAKEGLTGKGQAEASNNSTVVALLQYTAPDGTRYACVGDNSTKFGLFLHLATEGGAVGGMTAAAVAVGGGGGEAAAEQTGAGAAGEPGRWVAEAEQYEEWMVSTRTDLGNETLRGELEGLWRAGRLLSQYRDPADILTHSSKQTFPELLKSYMERMKSNHGEDIGRERLLSFMGRHQPRVAERFGYDPQRDPLATLAALKELLVWFREAFPYYYDKCSLCGNEEDNTFLGYVYPTEEERAFKAGRTELYHCSKCGAVTRFARFTAVSKVLDTRRGRCGEYSVLFMRFLEALGFACRWVVDWADHVWVEAMVGGRWVHLDPCEAAVDEPLLYQSWGKDQTYVLAFTRTEVVDVTSTYTSDFLTAKGRRQVGEAEMQSLLEEATKSLRMAASGSSSETPIDKPS